MLEDETSFVQYGQQNDYEFYTFRMQPAVPSSWNKWPTPENPGSKFKYASIEIDLAQDQLTWTRQTYSSLDWVGDLGGLYEALKVAGGLIVLPFASH